MSEFDPERRERLVERLGGGGQALITAADAESVPARRLADARCGCRAAPRAARRHDAAAAPRAPRPAFRAALERAAPRTRLAAVQAAWEESVGERIAAVASRSPSATGA